MLSSSEAKRHGIGSARSSTHTITGGVSIKVLATLGTARSSASRSLSNALIKMLYARSARGDPGREPREVVKHLSQCLGTFLEVSQCASLVTVVLPTLVPKGSMYGIYGNIYHQYTPNVSIYTIHGSFGLVFKKSYRGYRITQDHRGPSWIASWGDDAPRSSRRRCARGGSKVPRGEEGDDCTAQ